MEGPSEIIVASILGVVEGITEFLPVSSTGHLILVGHLLGFSGEKADTFEIFIQLGAILAVVVLYFRRFFGLLDFSTSSKSGLRGAVGLVKIGAACAPAFVLGALLHKFIKTHLFSAATVSIGFIAGAILILIVERFKKEPSVTSIEDISVPQCIGIGLFQCLALWPGMSRSGSTIIGALILGCSRVAAAEFSFLIAVPVMVAAVSFDMYKSISILSSDDLIPFAVGFIVSFICALVAVRSLITFLSRFTFTPFAWYRIVLGIIILMTLGNF